GDPLNSLILRVGKAVAVNTEDSTISITVDWPNAEQAYELAQAAQENFLEARHVQEITALGEVITLLEGRANALRGELEATVADVEQELRRSPSASGSRLALATGTPSDDEAVRLKSDLEAKERALADVEGMRRRRLVDLQAELVQMRGIYSE